LISPLPCEPVLRLEKLTIFYYIAVNFGTIDPGKSTGWVPKMKKTVLLRVLDSFVPSLLAFGLLLFSGCSTQRLAVRITGDLLVNGASALYEEEDLPLARQAIGSNLKLLEVFLKNDPDNEKLMLMAAEGYTSYALGFVEDTSPERASNFYLRARNYALRILKKNKPFAAALQMPLEQFRHALQGLSPKYTAALFWCANAWGSYINLNKTSTDALADLPKVQAMMEQVLHWDESFYYGGPHLFLGTLYASRPPILGGNPQKAKEHFERCLVLNHGRFLMAKLFYAKYYAVQVQDRKLFRRLLQEILAAPADILPEQRLANQIAKRKARALLKEENDLFF